MNTTGKIILISTAVLGAGSLTYWLYWKQKEEENSLLDLGLNKDKRERKKLRFNKKGSSNSPEQEESSNKEFAENIARFQKLDKFREDAPGTEYNLFYPYVPIHPFKNGSVVKKVLMIHADTGEFNASNGSSYVYDFRAVAKLDKEMVKAMKKTVNRKEYLDTFGRPLSFKTKGSYLMIVDFQGKHYLVPVLRFESFEEKWEWMLNPVQGHKSNLAGLEAETREDHLISLLV